MQISIEWFHLFLFQMKRHLLLLMLFVSSLCYADDITIVIKQKTGNETVLGLSTNPVITFEGEEMVITNDFTRISISLDDIDQYVVNNTSTGISNQKVNVHYSRGHILLSGIPEGESVQVFSVDGRPVSNQCANASGQIDINLEMLPIGIYIVKAFNQSIKVINK